MSEYQFKYTPRQLEALKLIGEGASNVMLFGGSRSGKTFCLCCLIGTIISMKPGIRVAILRRYLKDVRESVCMDTFPKAMKLRCGWLPEEFRASFHRNDMLFTHPNGSEVWFCGLDDKDRVEKILGKEFGLMYFNEVSQIPFQSIEMAKTRLAQRVHNFQNRCFYDCNPPSKTHWTYKMFVLKQNPDKTPLAFPDDYASMKMSPADNTENISKDYLDKTLASLKGKAKERFLYGNWTDDTENALWKRETMIDPFRETVNLNELERIVVGVDPAVTNKDNSDYTGIVVAGKKKKEDGKYHYYILTDNSIIGSPAVWAQLVIDTFNEYSADRVIAERNMGGDLVISMLHNLNAGLPVKTVFATRGKIIRAEPISALYEEGLVHHVAEFNDLEDEMTSYTGADGELSPDRMDALVWALTELADFGSVQKINFNLF